MAPHHPYPRVMGHNRVSAKKLHLAEFAAQVDKKSEAGVHIVGGIRQSRSNN
jgi:hypothetical protein